MIELVGGAGGVRRVEPTACRLGSFDEVGQFLDSLDLSRIQDALCTDGLPNTVPIGPGHAAFCAKQYKRWLVFLHHNPYFGSNGEQDEQNWRAAFKNLLPRYKEVYGVPLTRFVPRPATA